MRRDVLPGVVLIAALALVGIESSALRAQSTDSDAWWLTPQRLLQTNLREIDATMDVDQYVREVKEFGANIVLFNVGGIVANYPTKLKYHWRNTFMAGDLVGEVLGKLHKADVKMIGRFEWIALYNHSGRLENSFHPPIPIDNVRLSLRARRPIKRVISLTNGSELARTTRSSNEVEIVLPRLGVFEIVLVEYAR